MRHPHQEQTLFVMLKDYKAHVEERAEKGIPPLPLNAEQVASLVELIKEPPSGEEDLILDLLTNRTPAGVDPAAYVKAAFLTDIAKGKTSSPLINKKQATELLGTMLGGYNVESLIELLEDEQVGSIAADGLSSTLLMFNAKHDVIELSKKNKTKTKLKIKIKRWHGVAKWTWGVGDDEDDVCIVCQSAFEGVAPGVKFPGDECPVVWGKCGHAFHLQCVSTWL